MSTFTVRPSNSEKEAFRIKLTAASLLSLKVRPGDVVLLELPNDEPSTPRAAIAWENSGGGMKDTIVQTSKTLQDLYGFKLGDRVGITRSTATLQASDFVIVKSVIAELSIQDQESWQHMLSAVVPLKHDILAPSQKILVEVGRRKGEFEVVDVGGGLLGRISDSTQFTFTDRIQKSSTSATRDRLKLSFEGVGGLQREIKQLEKIIRRRLSPDITKHWPKFQNHQGILLYGSKGTGKTLLQESIAKSQWGSVVRWTPGTKLPKAIYPRLIITDLSEANSTNKGISELLNVFHEIEGTHTIVIGETRHPNDISERLRAGSAFSMEVEIPVPNSEQRLDILRTLRDDSSQPSDEQLADLAARTHGYVGADLINVLTEVWMLAVDRWEGYTVNSTEHSETNNTTKPSSELTNGDTESHQTSREERPETILQPDIDNAIANIRPSALQEVFLEKPNVHWTDIGGHHDLKRRLTTAVTRTLSPSLRLRMSKLGVEVTKGILLYGPPGCSKTLLAKALATEAELNFLAVKGAELNSMYVGESERAIRDVFRKARTAAPSILFFDEIDAIASRSSSSDGGGGSSSLNVLTTLLNEMDGFEELKNVIVVAATNKPQSIDTGLLRPGRFDHVVYVGLPDLETRREIFEQRFRNVNVESGVKTGLSGFAARTDGYSGAEVVAICRAAGEHAMDDEERNRDYVSEADVEWAIATTPRGVTRDVLREYEMWNAARSGLGG